MKIYVIRHGETDANKQGILQGRTNTPVNESGIKLAKLTGKAMKGIVFDVCFSSPLERAMQTAKIVLKESGNYTPIFTDARIIEFSMGLYEGKSVKDTDPELSAIMKQYIDNPLDMPPFPEGENVRMVMKRTQKFLYELSKKDYNNVLVSTHGCALRCMLNCLYENKSDFWQGYVPYNCSVSIIDVQKKKMTLLEKDKVYYDPQLIIDRYK